MPLIATKGAASAQGFGEFAQTTAPVYIEDVYSTYLWTNVDNTTNPVVNGIDLSTKGGLVWMKARTRSDLSHILYDTNRGTSLSLSSNTTGAQTSGFGSITYNTNGFTKNSGGGSDTYVGWTFREQPKFFDVVTYTGNGIAGRTVSHNLGSVPGAIIVKKTSGATNWRVYHRSLGATKYLELNTLEFESTETTIWNNTAPTSTVFSVGTDDGVNTNGATYVAYLFAHDAGGFGDAGSDNVITCGSYTGNGSATGPTVTLGYEPQWVLLKRSTGATANWILADNMRGTPVDGATAILYPNGSDSEETSTTAVSPTATGFQVKVAGTTYNANGATYIYIAIRRGPMKTPTSGTSVYSAITRTGTGAAATVSSGFPVDMTIIKNRTDITANSVFDRLRGPLVTVGTNGTYAEYSESGSVTGFDSNTGLFLGAQSGGSVNNSSQPYVNWMFRRAPGFFDVVCYTGTGSATTVSHNLGVAPELMIVKRRNSSTYGDWYVYAASQGATKFLLLNLTDAVATNSGPWNNTAPTSSVFTAGSDLSINSTATYVAYLFASVSGVSKVGSYTGTGALQTVNCGFTTGARFVLIKRTDSTGDWYVWDSARGIVAGDDPYLLLNSTAAEVTNTDYVDTYSAGFEISSTAPAAINANGGTFIFLAVA